MTRLRSRRFDDSSIRLCFLQFREESLEVFERVTANEDADTIENHVEYLLEYSGVNLGERQHRDRDNRY